MWREELAGRLEVHRKRRSRLRGNFDPASSLDLAFDDPTGEADAGPLDADLLESPSESKEVEFPSSDSQENLPVLDSVPLTRPAGDARAMTTAAVEAGEAPLDRARQRPQRMEIILESSPVASSAAPSHRAAGKRPVAPLGRRFAAGLVDALVLLLGGALFSLIFWVVGGHVSYNPLNLALLGTIATLFVLVYFGVFTALSSSTPGLLWMNLEVQSLEGGPPSPKESFWRAFGYLVSMGSLMLGFVWAVVDSDHLTWHDHMSNTFVTPLER